MRHAARLAVALLLLAGTARAQTADTMSRGDKTFLTRRDLVTSGLALGAAALLTTWDDDIAIASRGSRYQDSSVINFANRASKVNETTLTVGGIVIYGIGRLTKSRNVADIALHATESVVLASLASQLIRGPRRSTASYRCIRARSFSSAAVDGRGARLASRQ